MITVAQLLEVLRSLDPDTIVWRAGGYFDDDVAVTEAEYLAPTDPDGRVYVGIGRVVIR